MIQKRFLTFCKKKRYGINNLLDKWDDMIDEIIEKGEAMNKPHLAELKKVRFNLGKEKIIEILETSLINEHMDILCSKNFRVVTDTTLWGMHLPEIMNKIQDLRYFGAWKYATLKAKRRSSLFDKGDGRRRSSLFKAKEKLSINNLRGMENIVRLMRMQGELQVLEFELSNKMLANLILNAYGISGPTLLEP